MVVDGDRCDRRNSLIRRIFFLSKLKGFGVTRIDALGQRFDPALHEAVTMVPTNDPAQEGVVCGVLTPGYLINEGVLRPAMVAVGLSSNHAVSA